MGCIHECGGAGRHDSKAAHGCLSLKGEGDQERCLRTEEIKCHPGLQKERGARELLTSHPHLNPWEGDAVPHSGSNVCPHG